MRPSTKDKPAVDHESDERSGRPGPWFAIFIGPLAWAADFALSLGLTPRACIVQSTALLLVFTAIALGAALAGLLVAISRWRELPSSTRRPGASRADPRRFLALSGIAVSGGFLVAILAAAIPRLLMNPCI